MRRFLKWFGIALVALAALVLVLRLLWFDVAVIAGPDMLPGMKPDSLAVVNRRAEPRRGDLVMYRAKSGAWQIRRVIALPGERFSTREGRPVVDGRLATWEEVSSFVRNGRTYKVHRETLGGRSYLVADDLRRSVSDLEERVVDGYYLMADNREHARDSRSDGPVARSRIRGVVIW